MGIDPIQVRVVHGAKGRLGSYRAMMGPVSRPVPREVSVDIHGAVKHTGDVDGLVSRDQVRDAVGTARENADLAACAICQRR